MGRSPACPKVCTDHVLEYISLRNRMDSPSDCPLVTFPLVLLLSGVAHHRFAPHLYSTSCGPSLPLLPSSLPAICCLPTCSLCIPGLSTMLSSESPHLLDWANFDGRHMCRTRVRKTNSLNFQTTGQRAEEWRSKNIIHTRTTMGIWEAKNVRMCEKNMIRHAHQLLWRRSELVACLLRRQQTDVEG